VNVSIRRLAPSDDRQDFHSGNHDLDRFFARYAGQNQFRHHIGVTYVAIADAGKIVGFATITASELMTRAIPEPLRKGLPAYPLPVLRVARLAVDQQAQGQGVAQSLLRAVFTLAHRMSEDMGCLGVAVDAKPEAVGFYRKLGFISLEVLAGELGERPQPLPMFLELGAIPLPPK
jgi:GNAT superfamily N-acetyltransferase